MPAAVPLNRRLALVLCALLAACQPLPPAEESRSPARDAGSATAHVAPATPSQIYGELFERVQLEAVFPDSKTFVDALPVRAPEQIMREYRDAASRDGFDLREFVVSRFTPPQSDAAVYRTIPGQDVREHIDRLWSVLERKPDDQRPYSSRLPLPERYIVPGGRFNEIYYWDSYFTMLGLEESGRHDLTISMLKNFAHLIDEYGHIPNGNRTYYLSRSQPPFFAAMVELAAARDGERIYGEYLPQLKREYAFWMDGADSLAARRRAATRRAHALTARCSIATGTTAIRPAKSRIVKTLQPRARRSSRPRRSTAICAPLRKAAGTSVRAGLRTAKRLRRSAPPI